MANCVHVYALFMFVSCTLCKAQTKPDLQKNHIQYDTKAAITSAAPKSISRNIKQDSKGNIWIAAFDGIFRYDGKSFTNITSKVSSARFFSVLEDKKGNMWFGTIGSGIYHYDGKSFQNFTTNEGLVNNEIVCIYEDKAGHIWFGANGGVSLYDPSRTDGKLFRNYIMTGDSIIEDRTGKSVPNLQRPPHEINSIVEDKAGKFWLGTRENTFVFDGSTFKTIIHNGEPFTNVRTIIEDKKGNIWLGGNDGLWRYDGSTFTNLTRNFVGYIHEDKRGNIWTSSDVANETGWVKGWALSRYDEKSLSDQKPAVTEIKSDYKPIKGMIFGILEAQDGTIWFGATDGVYRYNGNAITDYQGKKVGE